MSIILLDVKESIILRLKIRKNCECCPLDSICNFCNLHNQNMKGLTGQCPVWPYIVGLENATVRVDLSQLLSHVIFSITYPGQSGEGIFSNCRYGDCPVRYVLIIQSNDSIQHSIQNAVWPIHSPTTKSFHLYSSQVLLKK